MLSQPHPRGRRFQVKAEQIEVGKTYRFTDDAKLRTVVLIQHGRVYYKLTEPGLCYDHSIKAFRLLADCEVETPEVGR
jgi:hypothetical protein